MAIVDRYLVDCAGIVIAYCKFTGDSFPSRA
jgi:hypothetical protein